MYAFAFFDELILHLNKSIEVRRACTPATPSHVVYTNLAIGHAQLDQWDIAREYAELALEVIPACESASAYKLWHNLAHIYDQLGNSVMAAVCQEEASIRKQISNGHTL